MSDIFRKLTQHDGSSDPRGTGPDVQPDSFFPGLSKLKNLAILSLILSVAALAMGAFALRTVTTDKKNAQSSQLSLSQLKQKLKDLDVELTTYRSELTQLKEKMDVIPKLREQFKKDVDKLSSQVNGFDAQMKSLQSDLSPALPPETEDVTEVLNEASSFLGETKSKVDTWKNSASSFVAESEDDSAADELNFNAPSPKGGAAADSGKSASEGKRASTITNTQAEYKILSVNAKFNFVVVNTGMQNGAKIGDDLIILRSGKQIAKVKIEKLYDNFSAATIVEQDDTNPIQQGDGAALHA